jgi:hypothetical protein
MINYCYLIIIYFYIFVFITLSFLFEILCRQSIFMERSYVFALACTAFAWFLVLDVVMVDDMRLYELLSVEHN